MSINRTPQVNLFGNLGSDPEEKTLPSRTSFREVYNPVTNSVEERVFTTEPRTFLVFSVAVNGTAENGEVITNWIRCVDWHSRAKLYRKGNRVRVRGFFKNRGYLKDGEIKTIREFVVVDTRLESQQARTDDVAA